MLFSPGTRRACAPPIPEEVLLKLALLGCRLEWRNDLFAWQVVRGQHGLVVDLLVDGYEEDWTRALDWIAETVCKGRLPAGWQNTQHVDTMPIEAAAVINEEAFRHD